MSENQRRELFTGKVFLAPLTQGGNLPFRRLLVELGARATTGEMALAHKVVRRARGEMALLRRAPEEPLFGVQLAGRRPEQLAAAAKIAEEMGASFVDLNLGCPIDLFCRRGIGAALMRKPRKVHELVRAMREAVDIPVSVKLRSGWEEGKPSYLEVGRAAEEGGADAVAMHGRSRKQRYKKAADWEAIGELASALSIPVIGNGDLLTWREVEWRWKESGCASVMLGRGALIKPWIFAEIRDRRDHLLPPTERWRVLRRFRDLALEHFGNDERGRRRVEALLVWHLDFFHRYRPVPSEELDPEDHPLIQRREASPPDAEGDLALLYRGDEESRARLAGLLMAEVEASGERTWQAPSHALVGSAILGTP